MRSDDVDALLAGLPSSPRAARSTGGPCPHCGHPYGRDAPAVPCAHLLASSYEDLGPFDVTEDDPPGMVRFGERDVPWPVAGPWLEALVTGGAVERLERVVERGEHRLTWRWWLTEEPTSMGLPPALRGP